MTRGCRRYVLLWCPPPVAFLITVLCLNQHRQRRPPRPALHNDIKDAVARRMLQWIPTSLPRTEVYTWMYPDQNCGEEFSRNHFNKDSYSACSLSWAQSQPFSSFFFFFGFSWGVFCTNLLCNIVQLDVDLGILVFVSFTIKCMLFMDSFRTLFSDFIAVWCSTLCLTSMIHAKASEWLKTLELALNSSSKHF